MTKVNEVRIGNLFFWKQNYLSGVSPVVFIENREESKTPFYTPCFRLESGGLSYVSEPIILTEEWLLKFGFEKHNETHVYNFNKMRIDWFDKPLIRFRATNDSYEEQLFQLRDIQFVHELQNLYYALTGEELVVSES